jgi:hypothetical protein
VTATSTMRSRLSSGVFGRTMTTILETNGDS